ncbi:hypothetical protein EDB85DRAFT_2183174 [Lactarius pseudohatsudake]|nr:hypothetical protein EDB85DRAFT_2183174 [Lactarius pseudohatsudake]
MATAAGSTRALPQDIGSRYLSYIFPPHTGNDLDWPLKTSDDIQLDGVEFSSLPSGLHLVEQDVVLHEGRPARRVRFYLAPDIRARPARLLSSLGILLARSLRPRPWRHIPALKALVRDLHSDSAAQGYSSQAVWEPARRFFEPRKARLEDLGGAGTWHRWSEELEFDTDDGGVEDGSDWYEQYTHASPTLHLPHLLRALGPSSLTLYKHVLGRRRILIYTASPMLPQLKGKHINVLGIVTPHDIDMIERESQTGCGWIARTTEAVSSRSRSYDLIDLTSYAPTERSAPPRAQRHPSLNPGLWTELDRILQLDADTNGVARASCIGPGLGVGGSVGRVRGRMHRLREALLRPMAQQQYQWNSNGTGVSRAGSPRERSGRRARVPTNEDGVVLVRSRRTRTTLALLQIFHAQRRFLISRLATVLPSDPSTVPSLPDAQLTPRDLLTRALGPLSSLDARFIEWLTEEYAGGARMSVCRGWRDFLGGLVGAGVGGSGAASS